MDTSTAVAVGSLIVAAASLALTALLALLNRRAQVDDRAAQSREAHQVRLWDVKLPALIDYLVWIEAHCDADAPPPRFPQPDDALLVRVKTFGPDGVGELIARARLAMTAVREARHRMQLGSISLEDASRAAYQADFLLSSLRQLLRDDLLAEPSRDLRARQRAFLTGVKREVLTRSSESTADPDQR